MCREMILAIGVSFYLVLFWAELGNGLRAVLQLNNQSVLHGVESSGVIAF